MQFGLTMEEVNAAHHILVTSYTGWMGCLVISSTPHCLRKGYQIQ